MPGRLSQCQFNSTEKDLIFCFRRHSFNRNYVLPDFPRPFTRFPMDIAIV